MANRKMLDAQLVKLVADMGQYDVLQKLTNEQERLVMANVYMWWRDARQVNGYLDECYERNSITHNKTRDGLNFNPLLKLCTSSNISSSDLTTWSKALKVLHTDFEAHPKHYKHDPISNLCHFIKQKGGKTGLAGYHIAQANDDEDLALEDMQLYTLSEMEFLPTLQQAAKNHFEAKQLTAIALPALQATADGYSVVVVKKQGDEYVLVGTTNEIKLIDSALIATYRNDFEALPLTMRVVLEPLHILNVPKALASSAEKLIEASNLVDAWDPKRRKEKAYKRLTYITREQQFLLSNMQVSSGVVVKAKPKSEVITLEHGDLFLSNSTRQSVEIRLLQQGAFNLFKPSAEQKFKNIPVGFLAGCYVDLQTKLDIESADGVNETDIKQHTTNLQHPPLSFIPFHKAFGDARVQVTNKTKRIKPAWQATVDLDWLRFASTEFFDKWIAEYGKKSMRPVNKTLGLALSADALAVAYEFDGEQGFDNLKRIALPKKSARGAAELVMRSADFAFVVRQIADLNVVGNIELMADSDGLVLTFETTASSYECWIPACDELGVRKSKHFDAYEVVQSDTFKMHIDLEDDVQETTDEELELIRQNIKRVKLKQQSKHKKAGKRKAASTKKAKP
jgi:hypothetical protein